VLIRTGPASSNLIQGRAEAAIAAQGSAVDDVPMQVVPFKRRPHPVDLPLCAAAGATVFGLTFLSCWLLAVVHWPWAPRGLVDFFAPNPIETVDALLVGGDYALVSGALALFVTVWQTARNWRLTRLGAFRRLCYTGAQSVSFKKIQSPPERNNLRCSRKYGIS